jgi:hypothetical protein
MVICNPLITLGKHGMELDDDLSHRPKVDEIGR